jgi:peptide/nickel transport system ATP-binding protein
MIFQEPMTSLNRSLPSGADCGGSPFANKISKKEAMERAKEMLEMVGIPGQRCDDIAGISAPRHEAARCYCHCTGV